MTSQDITRAIAQTSVRAVVTIAAVGAFLAGEAGILGADDTSNLKEFALFTAAFYFGGQVK